MRMHALPASCVLGVPSRREGKPPWSPLANNTRCPRKLTPHHSGTPLLSTQGYCEHKTSVPSRLPRPPAGGPLRLQAMRLREQTLRVELENLRTELGQLPQKPKKPKGVAAMLLFVRKLRKKIEVRIKAFTSFSQISVGVSFNMGPSFRFPPLVEKTTAGLSIFNLNLMPNLGIQCMQSKFDYIDEMVAVTVAPIAMCVLLFVVYKLNMAYERFTIDKLAHKYAFDTVELNQLLGIEGGEGAKKDRH